MFTDAILPPARGHGFASSGFVNRLGSIQAQTVLGVGT
jgi:hypothetical protein